MAASTMTERKRKTKGWQPAPVELIESFALSVRVLPGITKRKMFGYPAAFIHGRLFAGLFEDNMVLKLPLPARSAFLKLPGAARFEPIPGRTMGEFVVVPSSLVKNRAKLNPWLESAYTYVKSLPSKKATKRS